MAPSNQEDAWEKRRGSDASLDEKVHSGHIEKIAGAIADTDDIATSIDKLPVSMFVWMVAVTASMAGLLFGYDTGVISGATAYMGSDLTGTPITSNEKELVTSLCSGGAFFGSIFAGNTADRVCIHETNLSHDIVRTVVIY